MFTLDAGQNGDAYALASLLAFALNIVHLIFVIAFGLSLLINTRREAKSDQTAITSHKKKQSQTAPRPGARANSIEMQSTRRSSSPHSKPKPKPESKSNKHKAGKPTLKVKLSRDGPKPKSKETADTHGSIEMLPFPASPESPKSKAKSNSSRKKGKETQKEAPMTARSKAMVVKEVQEHEGKEILGLKEVLETNDLVEEVSSVRVTRRSVTTKAARSSTQSQDSLPDTPTPVDAFSDKQNAALASDAEIIQIEDVSITRRVIVKRKIDTGTSQVVD